MPLSKKLLIAAVCCSVAGHCSIMYGIINPNSESSSSTTQSTSLDEQLIDAVANNEVEKVKALLVNGANMNATSNSLSHYYYGYTALMIALANGYTDIVQALLDVGADVNLKSTTANKTTPLMVAVKRNAQADIVQVQQLLNKGAKVDLKDYYGQTALRFAVSRGCLAVVQALLGAGANPDLQDNDGNVVLKLAAYQLWPELKSYPDIVQALLEAGANPNLRDSNGSTVLCYSIRYIARLNESHKNDPEFASKIALTYKLIIELLKRGADPLIKGFQDKTPLDLANTIGNEVIRTRVIALINRCRQRYLAELPEKRPILRTYMINDIAESIVDKY